MAGQTTTEVSATHQAAKPGQHDKLSLATFVDENKNLLNTLGVFAALTAFATTLPLKAPGYLIAFLFMFATILIWLELYAKFPRNKSSRLSWFENVMWFGLFALVAYWLLAFRTAWHDFLAVPIAVVLWEVLVFGDKPLGLLGRIFPRSSGKGSDHRSLVYGLAAFVLLLVSLLIAIFAARPLNSWLDGIRTLIETGSPPR